MKTGCDNRSPVMIVPNFDTRGIQHKPELLGDFRISLLCDTKLVMTRNIFYCTIYVLCVKQYILTSIAYRDPLSKHNRFYKQTRKTHLQRQHATWFCYYSISQGPCIHSVENQIISVELNISVFGNFTSNTRDYRSKYMAGRISLKNVRSSYSTLVQFSL